MNTRHTLTCILALGCASTKSGSGAELDSGAEPAPSETCGSDSTAVALPTSDGETLQADWWPAAAPGAPAVVLFHMEPSTHNADDYPIRVREALHDSGLAVLVPNRRGAGGSTGDPAVASLAPGALADAEAAMGFLTSTDRPCPVNTTRIALVGADDGTTPTFDYLRLHGSGVPDVAALVWLSPDTYTTQNQSSLESVVANDRASVSIPMLWLYPQNEDWAGTYVTADVPGAWEFIERDTAHGTDMFDGGALEADTLHSLTEFLRRVLADDD
jgi:pimeloyl-ACP methyl ester carboxylesterase